MEGGSTELHDRLNRTPLSNRGSTEYVLTLRDLSQSENFFNTTPVGVESVWFTRIHSPWVPDNRWKMMSMSRLDELFSKLVRHQAWRMEGPAALYLVRKLICIVGFRCTYAIAHCAFSYMLIMGWAKNLPGWLFPIKRTSLSACNLHALQWHWSRWDPSPNLKYINRVKQPGETVLGNLETSTEPDENCDRRWSSELCARRQ